MGALKDKILRGALAMAAPDVEVVDGRGTILISSEEGETQENNDKLLKVSSSDRGIFFLILQMWSLVIKLTMVSILSVDLKSPVRKMLVAEAYCAQQDQKSRVEICATLKIMKFSLSIFLFACRLPRCCHPIHMRTSSGHYLNAYLIFGEILLKLTMMWPS